MSVTYTYIISIEADADCRDKVESELMYYLLEDLPSYVMHDGAEETGPVRSIVLTRQSDGRTVGRVEHDCDEAERISWCYQDEEEEEEDLL